MTSEQTVKHLLKLNRKRFQQVRQDRINGCWNPEGTARTDARLDEIEKQFVELSILRTAMKVG